MKHATLGTLDVGRIGLGAMGMSTAFTGAGKDDAESIRTIHRALDLGVTLLDTAEIYGPFTNEELVGEAIKVVVTRSCSPRSSAWSRTPAMARAISTAARPMSAPPFEGSLRRLGTDHVDLYYQHRVDPGTPIEDTVGALAELVKEGKVRHIGLSEAWVGTIRRAQAVHPDHRPPVRVLVVHPGSGGRGVATPAGARHRIRRLLPARKGHADREGPLIGRAGRHRFPENQSALRGRELPTQSATRRRSGGHRSRGRRHAGSGCAGLALDEGDDIVPIPGTKRVSRVEENVGADGVELSSEQIDRLDKLPPAAGEHHNEQQMRMIER